MEPPQIQTVALTKANKVLTVIPAEMTTEEQILREVVYSMQFIPGNAIVLAAPQQELTVSPTVNISFLSL